MIRDEFPAVKLIANKDNKLFAIANNQGAEIASGDYLLLLNSDTLVYGDNLQRMIDFLDRQQEDVICIGPKILNKDKSLQSCGMPRSGSLTQHFLSSFCLDKLVPLHRIIPELYRKPDRMHITGWVSGCCMIIPRKKYQEVGGLNEKLVFYGEEPEFGWRTHRLGYKTIYYSDAEIIHLGGASTTPKNKIDEDTFFKLDMQRYSSLVDLTFGRKKVITITKITIASLKFKSLFYKNKEEIQQRIKHERKVVNYFKSNPESQFKKNETNPY